MNKPLDRLRKLTLTLEAAAASNDWEGFRALLQAREAEIAKLPPGDYNDSAELLKLDARLQALVGTRMDSLRKRMQATVHVNRTARAFQAAQVQKARVDFAG